jgi:hypothetical protein
MHICILWKIKGRKNKNCYQFFFLKGTLTNNLKKVDTITLMTMFLRRHGSNFFYGPKLWRVSVSVENKCVIHQYAELMVNYILACNDSNYRNMSLLVKRKLFSSTNQSVFLNFNFHTIFYLLLYLFPILLIYVSHTINKEYCCKTTHN